MTKFTKNQVDDFIKLFGKIIDDHLDGQFTAVECIQEIHNHESNYQHADKTTDNRIYVPHEIYDLIKRTIILWKKDPARCKNCGKMLNHGDFLYKIHDINKTITFVGYACEGCHKTHLTRWMETGEVFNYAIKGRRH